MSGEKMHSKHFPGVELGKYIVSPDEAVKASLYCAILMNQHSLRHKNETHDVRHHWDKNYF